MKPKEIQNLFKEILLGESLPDVEDLQKLYLENSEFKNYCRLVSPKNYNDPDNELQDGPDISYHYRKLEVFFPEVKRICDAASNAMAKNVRVHAIYTRPQSPGFPLHYDFEEVLVYQKMGTKSWKVWKPFREEITVQSLAHDQKNSVLEHWSKISTSENYLLFPLESLFIPTGHPHVAWTKELHSLHYSFTF